MKQIQLNYKRKIKTNNKSAKPKKKKKKEVVQFSGENKKRVAAARLSKIIICKQVDSSDQNKKEINLL